MNVLKAQLMLLDPTHDDRLDRILRVVYDGIAVSEETIEQARESGSEDYLRVTEDSEADLVEQLVGFACTAAQVYISETISRTQRMHGSASRQRIVLSVTDGSSRSIMRFGNPTVNGSEYHRIEVISALANYSKHADEWPDWDRLDSRQSRTRDIIQAVGAQEGSTGNLRAGIHGLGLTALKDLPKLSEYCRSWRHELYAAYRREL